MNKHKTNTTHGTTRTPTRTNACHMNHHVATEPTQDTHTAPEPTHET